MRATLSDTEGRFLSDWDNAEAASVGEEIVAGCEGLRGGLFAGDQLEGGISIVWCDGETYGEAAVGAEGDFCEVVNGDGAGGDEDGGGFGEFVEEGEEFEFDFEIVGESVDEEVGLADGGFDGLGEGEIGELGVSGVGRRKNRSWQVGLILRAWGAAVLRPYKTVEIG
jgi:hypothetical protein